MKRKVFRIFRVLGAFFIFLAAVYFAIGFYYRDKFSFNTWINGVYCTGKTVEEANSELLLQKEAPVITVRDGSGDEAYIDLRECGYRLDERDSLQKLMDGQNPYGWISRLFRQRQETVTPKIEVDEELLREKWMESVFVRKELSRPEGKVNFLHSEEGYSLQDTMTGRFDIEGGFQKLLRVSLEGSDRLDLTEERLYYDLPYGEKEKKAFSLMEKIERFYQNRIVLDMGEEQIRLEKAALDVFLAKDSSGVPICGAEGFLSIDEKSVEAFITDLAQEYNTYGKKREFLSTRGDTVTVPAGTYGTELDEEKILGYLTGALQRCVENTGAPVSETYVPVYKREGYCRGKNDIGDTYIEIDLTEQKLYFYKEGECLVDTDIVTGNLRKKRGTPAGMFYVYGMQRNRILRGPGYASFVNYWMPVYKGIGIHDAGWRKEFGGEIYKTDGSHGCINIPGKNAKILYENVEIGMPVIIFN